MRCSLRICTPGPKLAHSEYHRRFLLYDSKVYIQLSQSVYRYINFGQARPLRRGFSADLVLLTLNVIDETKLALDVYVRHEIDVGAL